jgi:hypothetical protein
MDKCFEIDGPGVAYFCDGENDIVYSTIRFATKYPYTVYNLVCKLDRIVEDIRRRSEVIVWRLRPTISFRYNDKRSVDQDGLPCANDYKKGDAVIRIRCRLACYPKLSDNERYLFRISQEGSEDPVLGE